jgi:hypothetical protein
VTLGERLPQLTAFQELLRQAHGLCDVRLLAREWGQRLRLSSPADAEILIDSLAALVSAARQWKNPANPPAIPKNDDVAPFLQVRVHLLALIAADLHLLMLFGELDLITHRLERPHEADLVFDLRLDVREMRHVPSSDLGAPPFAELSPG